MHARSITICGLILSCVGLGCASVPAPAPLCPSPDRVQESAFGAWIAVETRAESNVPAHRPTSNEPTSRKGAPRIQGEFIAFATDSVFVLTPSRLEAVPLTDIQSARLYTFAPNIGALALWTLLGSLSTASHGMYLSFSLPVWIIGGTAAAVSESHAPEERVPGKSWEQLRVFARFPQGLPPGLDRSTLVYGPTAVTGRRPPER